MGLYQNMVTSMKVILEGGRDLGYCVLFASVLDRHRLNPKIMKKTYIPAFVMGLSYLSVHPAFQYLDCLLSIGVTANLLDR